MCFKIKYVLSFEMRINNIDESRLELNRLMLMEEKIKVKTDSVRQIKGYLEGNKNVFLRRGKVNMDENCIVFIERETKSIVKFNPIDEKYYSIKHLNMLDPFAIDYLKNSKRYIVSNHKNGGDKDKEQLEIKIFDININENKSFCIPDLIWPHDIIVTIDERFLFISDFDSNSVFKFEIGNELKVVGKCKQDKSIDIKIGSDKIFVVEACDYLVEEMKLIYLNGFGNSIKVLEADTFKELFVVKHSSLLEPQGLLIDEKSSLFYVVGLFVDENTLILDNYLHLFCFDLNSYKLLNTQLLNIHFKVTVCDLFLWNEPKRKKKTLFLSAFKDGIFAIDVE
jgi:hypothetical protein